MTWLVYMMFRGKGWGALVKDSGAQRPLLVALVTANPEVLLEAGASTVQRSRLKDGKGSAPRAWEDSTMTRSARWAKDPRDAQQAVS